VGGTPGSAATPDPAGAGPINPTGGGSGGSSSLPLITLVLCALAVGGGFLILAARRRRPDPDEPVVALAVAGAMPVPAVVPDRSEEPVKPRSRRGRARPAPDTSVAAVAIATPGQPAAPAWPSLPAAAVQLKEAAATPRWGRGRHHEEPEEPILAAAVPEPAPLADPADETGIPRWRRPSLRAARAASERGPIGPSYQLAFTGAAAAGTERRRVRYRVVRMSDAPDEIRSQEVGQLEENDEVEVLERYAGFVRVRTPEGTDGWVHRTTLGPPIENEEPEAEPSAPEFDIEAAFEDRRAHRAEEQPRALNPAPEPRARRAKKSA
jgi:hypothetical protein